MIEPALVNGLATKALVTVLDMATTGELTILLGEDTLVGSVLNVEDEMT